MGTAHLYHGTPLKDLPYLEPGVDGLVFACVDIRFAAVFMIGANLFTCTRNGGTIHAYLPMSQSRCLAQDRGGAIYVLDSAFFTPTDGTRFEWACPQRVIPAKVMKFVSGIAALQSFGVCLHFDELGATNST
jgi:hypothetical protein